MSQEATAPNSQEHPWLEEDAAEAISHWFFVDVLARHPDGDDVAILRRLVGWDESDPPDWIQYEYGEGITVQAKEIEEGRTKNLEGSVLQGAPLTAPESQEVRRSVPEVRSWLDRIPSNNEWGLNLPCICYELWGKEEIAERAKEAWQNLPIKSQNQLEDAGVFPLREGYFGSTIVHIPKAQPYLCGTHAIVVPDALEAWEPIRVVSEITEGPVRLSRGGRRVQEDQHGELGPQEKLGYIKLLYPDSEFAEQAKLDPQSPAEAWCAAPQLSGTPSGTTLTRRLSVGDGEKTSAAEVGLVREFRGTVEVEGGGSSEFQAAATQEPWMDRDPERGFSVPARIMHIPAGNPHAKAKALNRLSGRGGTIGVVDRYAKQEPLDALSEWSDGIKLLTLQESFNKYLSAQWCNAHNIVVKIITKEMMHDRFVVGEEEAYLLGPSLHDIGSKPSFIAQASSHMVPTFQSLFERLWNNADPP